MVQIIFNRSNLYLSFLFVAMFFGSCNKPSVCDCANTKDEELMQKCSDAYEKKWQEHMKKAYLGTGELPTSIGDVRFYRWQYFRDECEKSGGKPDNANFLRYMD
jgi:hypothetical protein